jgi:hypothetical protein
MRKTCKDCEHWKATHSSWGKCDIALNGQWFTNHTKLKPQGYRARHTNSREKGNKACVVRFKEKQEVKLDKNDCLHFTIEDFS